MSTLLMTCSFSWMETLKVTFRTPLAHPSIPLYPPFIRQECPRPAAVPGTMPRHEDEDTAASCPRGAGLQVGDTSSPLYHHETSVRARGAGLLLLCSPLSEKGPPPESLPGSTEPTLLGSPAGAPGTSDCSETTLPRAREHLFTGKVLTPINTQSGHS